MALGNEPNPGIPQSASLPFTSVLHVCACFSKWTDRSHLWGAAQVGVLVNWKHPYMGLFFWQCWGQEASGVVSGTVWLWDRVERTWALETSGHHSLLWASVFSSLKWTCGRIHSSVLGKILRDVTVTRVYKPRGHGRLLLLLSEEAISVLLPEDMAWGWLSYLQDVPQRWAGWAACPSSSSLSPPLTHSFVTSLSSCPQFPSFLLFLMLIKTPALGKQQGWT